MPKTSPLLILPDEQIPAYLADHLSELLEAELPPAAVFTTRLLSMPSSSRRALQRAVMNTLMSGNQSLTDHVLKRIDGPAVPPTAANWIGDFGAMDKLSWQAKSPAWRTLDASDQQRVGRLFDLVSLLRREVTAETTSQPRPTSEPVRPFIPSIQRIADAAGASLTDPLVHNRFSTVVKSGIKGIRSSGQLAEILSRSVDLGGLGFDQPTVQKVLAAIAPLALQYAQGDLMLTEEKLKAPNTDMMRAPVMPTVIPEPVTMTPQPQPMPPLPVRPRPIPVQPPTPFLPSRRFTHPRRSLVHDIRQPKSKLVGPIEELRRLDLQSFHRLGPDAVAMVQKVKEKIDLLASESLTQKAEGVKAWKQSAVNQLYLAIGAASMSLGKSVEAIIKDRLSGNEPTITPVEFRAIADLNKALRF